ncbi:glycosyltransferase [Alistipes sp.]|uniref:glycosyltransferase n=1 Tax=Alistipes sp. TaxID=1872444 RepID=UPI003AEF21D7
MTVAFFFESDINPIKGGTERVTWSVAEYLIKQGTIVYFIAHQQRPDYDKSLISRHIFLPDPIGFETIENISFLKRMLHEKQIDVLINQGAFSDEIRICNTMVLGDTTKIISVIHYNLPGDAYHFNETLHPCFSGTDLKEKIKSTLQQLRKPVLKRRALRNKRKELISICNYSDAIVLLSERYKTDFLKLTGGKGKGKLHAIPNPNTYPTISSIFEKEKLVLYVGRLCYEQKRVDFLIRIWKMIEKEIPGWELVIVGDGPEKSRLFAQAKGLERIRFAGYQDPTSFYEKAQIVCLTSPYEGFGMVLTEGMQYGAVPIAFDSYQAIHDIIDHEKNGLLIKPFDLSDYALNLKELILNDAKRAVLANNARQKTDDFEPQKIGAQWISLLTKLTLNS